MAPRLKTFCYSDGFHAWTVAASSRAKALRAFGVTRDLFKDGSAKEITDGPDREVALASPGELIERGLTVDVGEAVRAKAKEPTKSKARARKAVQVLEQELAELQGRHDAEVEALAARRRELEAEAEALKARQDKARAALNARLKAARAKLSG